MSAPSCIYETKVSKEIASCILFMSFASGPSITYRPVMIFIDGGYLRNNLKELFDDDRIDFAGFPHLIVKFWSWGLVYGELIRAYYYDAIVDPTEDLKEFKEQQKYFDEIRACECYEVRLGRLIKTPDGNRQKGVDTLIALDMITKAFLNHFDIAYLVAGDDDFVDVVKNVKMFTGKRVYGVYFSKHISERLLANLDYGKALDTQSSSDLRNLMKKQ